MKFYFLILLSYGCLNPAFSQQKEVSIAKIQSLAQKKVQCIEDSTQTLTTFCSLGLDGFSVNLYSAFLDKKTNELRLIGRVCLTKMKNSSGLSDIEIFKSKKSGNIIGTRVKVGETTFDNQNISNDGFFDVTFKIEQGEYLFFYSPRYFIFEYAISQVLRL